MTLSGATMSNLIDHPEESIPDRDLTIACVFWKGEFRGRENHYSEDWVRRMKNMVARNLQVPHRFVCLSNVPVPAERIPLENPYLWKGWWAKMELFRPGIFSGRVLYLDLDLVVLKDLLPFLEPDSDFKILPASRSKKVGRMDPGVVHGFNSSVMSFDPEKASKYWEIFSGDPIHFMNLFRGDQDFLKHFGSQDIDLFHHTWVKKIKDLSNPWIRPEKEKIILCMPGKNIEASMKYEWIKEIWQ